MPFINSILHNDLYKFSMSNYYIQNFPEASGTFTFHDRNNTEYDEMFVRILKDELSQLSKLFLQKNEFDWAVKTIPYIPQFYWEWLRSFRYEPNKIDIYLSNTRFLLNFSNLILCFDILNFKFCIAFVIICVPLTIK